MVAGMVAVMADGMVADMTTDNFFLSFLADMDLDMVADKGVDMLADMVTGHRCLLIGPTLFRPEP